MKKKLGFTLAEVLITLGIIGVVSALTIPTLMNNYQTKEKSTKLKKFYSTMQQAMLMSTIDNGEVGEWEKDGGTSGDITDEDGNIDMSANISVVNKYFTTYLKPYLKVSSIKESTLEERTLGLGELQVTFADGSLIVLHNGDCVDVTYFFKKPNLKKPIKEGRERINFTICPTKICDAPHLAKESCGRLAIVGGIIYGKVWAENARQNCLDGNNYACSVYLYNNHFEYPSDYPLK